MSKRQSYFIWYDKCLQKVWYFACSPARLGPNFRTSTKVPNSKNTVGNPIHFFKMKKPKARNPPLFRIDFWCRRSFARDDSVFYPRKLDFFVRRSGDFKMNFILGL